MINLIDSWWGRLNPDDQDGIIAILILFVFLPALGLFVIKVLS